MHKVPHPQTAPCSHYQIINTVKNGTKLMINDWKQNHICTAQNHKISWTAADQGLCIGRGGEGTVKASSDPCLLDALPNTEYQDNYFNIFNNFGFVTHAKRTFLNSDLFSRARVQVCSAELDCEGRVMDIIRRRDGGAELDHFTLKSQVTHAKGLHVHTKVLQSMTVCIPITVTHVLVPIYIP